MTGSVKAKIILDTKDFKDAIGTIKKEVKGLNTALEKAGLTSLQKDGKSAQQTIKKLQDQIASLKKEITGLHNKQKEGKGIERIFNTQTQSIVKQNEALQNLNRTTQRVNKEAKGMGTAFNPSNTALKNAGLALNTFERGLKTTKTSLNSIGKDQSLVQLGSTAKKGEEYMNNLYRSMQKVRSVIISIKTIVKTLGVMKVWDFAFDLIEGAKQTYIAKNEMMSLLERNSKVSSAGINTFNKALDETVSKFQKVNKYNLGETAASVGLEFNLSANEMAKSLKVISMIQNEYVRAGRTTEEAALAVKDILQGEFMRLSRETGIGKKDLIGYGWDGDKKNVLGLMEALEKAGKDRNWEAFASKATSLNDVITITQSRFSEFGADLANNVEPVIVGVFNGLINAVDGLKAGFEGLNPFQKSLVTFAAIPTAVVGASTAFLSLNKNMGLADIATIGWSKSILTAALNLDKLDVINHGFKNTLLASITGTKAATVANTGFAKSLAARLAGVQQVNVATFGLRDAMFAEQVAMRKGIDITKIATTSSRQALGLDLNRAQRLAVLTRGIEVNTAREMSRGRALLATARSTKVLTTATLGLLSVGVIVWLSTLSTHLEKVKKNIDGLNNVVENGETMVKDAKSQWQGYKDEVASLDTEIAKAKANGKNTIVLEQKRQRALEDSYQAYKNFGDIQRANNYAQEQSDRLKKKQQSIDLKHTSMLSAAYEKLGNTQYHARELASDYWSQVKGGVYYEDIALNKYNDRLKEGTLHMANHAYEIKKAGGNQEEVNKYMTDYNMLLKDTSEKWKKFFEGDLMSGLYAGLGEIRLIITDITNNPQFIVFTNKLNQAWKEFQPTLDSIVKSLGWLLDRLLDFGNWFLSNPTGRYVAMWSAIAGGIGLVAWKVKGFLPSAKGMVDFFKNAKDGASNLIGRLRGLSSATKKASDAIDESGMGASLGKTPSSTGGISKTWKKGEFKSTVLNDSKTIARDYAKAAVHLALIMGLVTEAILLINAPMLALAGTGEVFKGLEPQIRKGIDGLSLIAPTVGALMIPIVAYMAVMNKWGGAFADVGGTAGFISAAKAIAMGMALVTEAIGLLALPMGAFAALGWVKSMLGNWVEKGKEAIEITSSALQSLYPIVPVFATAIAMGVIALTGVGFVAEAAAIGAGMLLVSEAILSLALPMKSIADLGSNDVNIDGVRKGAEKINSTAIALSYVDNAMTTLNGIGWDLLADNIKSLAHIDMKSTLYSLTSEDGVLQQLSDFNDRFKGFNFTSIDTNKAGQINTTATGITAIGNNLKNLYSALKNLPDFDSGTSYNGTSLQGTAYAKMNEQDSGGLNNYFDKLNAPLSQLKTFVDKFNNNESFNIQPIKQERIDAINRASSMMTSVKTAVDNVKNAMSGISGANWETSMATGGWLAAAGNFLVHESGAGDYKSSIGSSLHEMELVLSDLATFGRKIAGDNVSSTDVSSLTDLASKVSGAMNGLVKAVNDGASKVKSNAVNIGKSLVTGVQSGIMNGKGGAYNTSKAFGETLAKRFKEGVHHMQEYMTWELSYVKQELIRRKADLGAASYDLATHVSNQYKAGLDMNSPGRMARTTNEELGYIGGFIENATQGLSAKVKGLAGALSSSFNPNFGDLNVSSFYDKLSSIPRMVNTVRTNVSSSFSGMFNNINTNLNNIAMSTQRSYTNILSKTRSSLANMKAATIKNIGGIKSSWHGMQRALISSAENIKSQTSAKIETLKKNMGTFWNKIKNPELLIKGDAGHPTNTSRPRRTYRPRGIKNSVSSKLAAGNPNGISQIYKAGKNNPLREQLAQLLQLLLHNKPAEAGGWNFNWNKPIQNRFNKWRTHFNAYEIDKHVNVGKFTNSTFPVKGIAEIAKAYIYDAISRTSYDFYFNSKFGNPLAAWSAGAFNCFDGTNLVLALANAFGFHGYSEHTTWDGIGHRFARIPGLGVIDSTAIQQRGTFKASGVNYAGSPPKHMKMGETHNYGDIHITINNNGKEITVDDKKINKQMTKKIYDIISPAFTTGA